MFPPDTSTLLTMPAPTGSATMLKITGTLSCTMVFVARVAVVFQRLGEAVVVVVREELLEHRLLAGQA